MILSNILGMGNSLDRDGSQLVNIDHCGSPPGVMMADTLSFNAKIGLVDF